MKGPTKVEQVKNAVREADGSGKSAKDLAMELGVSVATISSARRELVEDGLISKGKPGRRKGKHPQAQQPSASVEASDAASLSPDFAVSIDSTPAAEAEVVVEPDQDYIEPPDDAVIEASIALLDAEHAEAEPTSADAVESEVVELEAIPV